MFTVAVYVSPEVIVAGKIAEIGWYVPDLEADAPVVPLVASEMDWEAQGSPGVRFVDRATLMPTPTGKLGTCVIKFWSPSNVKFWIDV